MSDEKRLKIKYDMDGLTIRNPFYERLGEFDSPLDEFIDIGMNNLTWFAYHIFRWKGAPLKLAPFQSVVLQTLWDKTFPVLLMTRGGGKTFLLGLYAALHAILKQGSKIVIVAASFRQSKLVFDVIEELYNSSPLFRACCPLGPKSPSDERELRVGESIIKAIPLGNGERIRGIRANVILCDEYASIPQEIFQVVVRGFAAVSANPIETAQQIQSEEDLIKAGKMQGKDRKRRAGNKIIYSGTANFQFNHFYKLYQTHKKIIEGKYIGNPDEVNKALNLANEAAFDSDLDYRDYAIIQIPYDGLPRGFMDEKQISQAKLTMPKALFEMEYKCIFPSDSDGFFRRVLINDATPGANGKGTAFSVETTGQAGFEYVMGIDPARRTDNFAISILKLMGNGIYRNVYCASLNRKSWPEAVTIVRGLLRKFNIVRIAMDAGGGGTTVEDLLQNDKFMEPGDLAIWRHDDEEHTRFRGAHILEMVNFVPTWIADANYSLASDIEHQRILFPYRTAGNSSSAAEEIWDEIEEQINEMCKIVVTSTKTGVQHFDLPDVDTGTLNIIERKDRYSAILLSAYAARTYIGNANKKMTVQFPGGWVHEL